ncbi:MAG: hypothetical protein ACR2QO_26415 [Acidimicrobiales bacterium]
MLLPTTTAGRWSILAIAAFAILVVIFVVAVAAGQRGGQEFFDNLWLALPGLGAFVAAVAAFIVGVLAIAASGERGITVMAATVVGFLVTAFGVLEVVFPH